jgi:hypothetical protein
MMSNAEVIDGGRLEYSSICTSLPYSKDRLEELVHMMRKNGWDKTTPIVIWEGVILDGRHRYEAAEIAGVEPTYTTFVGTLEDAWDHVEVAHDVNDTRPITPEQRKFFLARRMNALGVQGQGAPEGNQNRVGGDTSNRANAPFVPTLEEHAKAAGVSRDTAKRENKERKEVFENPDNSDLAAMATTPEGYKEAKKEANKRKTFDEMLEDGDIVPQENNLPVWFNGKSFDAMASATAILVGASDLYCSGNETVSDLKRFLYLSINKGMDRDRNDYKIVALLTLRDAINELEEDLKEYLGTTKTETTH